MVTGSNWTAAENEELVRAYIEMLRLELTDNTYSKTDFRRRLQQTVKRSDGSIEYKLQNVSAALYEVNHPFINGYKPAKNLQDSLRAEVLRQLDASRDLESLAFEALRRPPVAKPDFVWAPTSAPAIELDDQTRLQHRPVRLDFVRIDAENRVLGLAGEQAVVARERSSLAAKGRPDLAARVEHVSQTQGDGLGFDVLSFDTRGAERFIEVKTTRLGKNWPMLISRNEVAFSAAEHERFELHRVFDFDKARVGLYVLPGDVRRSCALDPVTYRAVPA